MKFDFPTVSGFLGALLLVVAYGRKKSLSEIAYNWLNLVGAVLIATACILQSAWPPAALNVFWAGVAVWDMWKSRKRKSEPMPPKA